MKKIILTISVILCLLLVGCSQSINEEESVLETQEITSKGNLDIEVSPNNIEQTSSESQTEETLVNDEQASLKINIESIELDRNYNYLYNDEYESYYQDDFFNNLKLNGELINLGLEINDLTVQLRFYNGLNDNKELKYFGATNEFDAKLTNKYVNYNKNLFYNSNSINKFPKGSTSFEMKFDNVPYWNQKTDYKFEGLVSDSSSGWWNYDVDKAELILYHGENKVWSQEIDLPTPYKKDVNLNITQMDFSRLETENSIYGLTLVLNNKENTLLTKPTMKVIVNQLSYDSGFNVQNRVKENQYFIDSFDLPSEVISGVPIRITNLNLKKSFRSGTEDKQKGYTVTFQLYDGDELLDEEKYLIKCSGTCWKQGKQDTELVKSVPITDYGYSVKIEETILKIRSDVENMAIGPLIGIGEYVVIEVERSDFYKTNLELENPVLDLFCASTVTYALDEVIYEGFKETFKVPFVYGVCEDMVVNLRDGNNPTVYAASELSMD